MIVGTVIGTVVAPVQDRFYAGKKLLLVRAEDPAAGRATSDGVLLAVDRAGAGVGEKVLVLKEGSSARSLFEEEFAPVRTVIVGVVDEIEIDGARTFFAADAAGDDA
jgi:microcompartment protein CcmK/EutM